MQTMHPRWESERMTMKYPLGEQEMMIRDTARSFARKELAPVAAEANEKGFFPREIYGKLAELGFLGITVPEEYGGVGLDTMSLTLVIEEIAYVCASTAVTLSVHNSLTNWCLLKYGSEETKQRYLRPLARGEILGAYAITESEAGSDVSAIRMTAERKGSEYVLNGAKLFISTGDQAGAIVVFARTDPRERTRGISAFVVDPSCKGFSVGKVEKKLGLRASSTVELVFEDCRVPAGNLLGREGDGMKIALAGLDGGRIGIAAQSIGIAQAALDAGIRYALERKQFGSRVADFQATRWKIADRASEIEAARLLVYRAAKLRDSGERNTKEAAMAKLFASQAANRVAYDALQMHGGVGYTEDFVVERLFRDARVTEIYEGTSEIQRLVISREIIEEFEREHSD